MSDPKDRFRRIMLTHVSGRMCQNGYNCKEGVLYVVCPTQQPKSFGDWTSFKASVERQFDLQSLVCMASG